MIRAVIIEDEAVAARKIKRMLEERGLMVQQVISSNAELKPFLDGQPKVDLLFMDIHLSDGVVFDTLAESTNEIPIIFTTAYDEYALKAFKQRSIDYLLKPVDGEELDAALRKYEKSRPQMDIQSLMAALQPPAKAYKERFSVQVGDRIKSFSISEIQMFYSKDKANYLHSQGRAYPLDMTMEQLSQLLDPGQWFRINRGCLVCISAISSVVSYSNSRLKLQVEGTSDLDLIVSREKVKSFKSWLG